MLPYSFCRQNYDSYRHHSSASIRSLLEVGPRLVLYPELSSSTRYQQFVTYFRSTRLGVLHCICQFVAPTKYKLIIKHDLVPLVFGAGSVTRNALHTLPLLRSCYHLCKYHVNTSYNVGNSCRPIALLLFRWAPVPHTICNIVHSAVQNRPRYRKNVSC